MLSRKKRKLKAWQLGFNHICCGEEVYRIAPTNGPDKYHRYYKEWKRALYSASFIRMNRLFNEGRADII